MLARTTCPLGNSNCLSPAQAVQQLENNLIVPGVMSHAVDLHPVAVMVAILSGGELLDVPGALLAVPVLIALSVIIDEVQRERLARHGEVGGPGETARSLEGRQQRQWDRGHRMRSRGVSAGVFVLRPRG
jgi:hypothetical protein